jgi:hypothetical protein
MKTRKKEKQIAEKILTKVMESGMLLNGDGHFAVHEAKGKITCIEIYNGLFSFDSEIGRVEIHVTPHVCWDEEDNELPIDFFMRLCKKGGGYYYTVHLQKDKSDVLRKFFDYIDENKHQILQCDYEHGCSLFVTDVDFD